MEALEADTRELVTAQLGGKAAASPSQSWRLLTSAKPEAVLQIAFSSKSPAIQAKLKSFAGEWPQARNRMPYALMQEMRITPELPGYNDLLEKLFFELMDGNLSTPEESESVPRALLAARSAAPGQHAPHAHCKEGRQAGQVAVAQGPRRR